MENQTKLQLLKDKIKSIYPESCQEIENQISQKTKDTFRVRESDEEEAGIINRLTDLGFVISPADYSHTYVVESAPVGCSISKTNEVEAGKIYLQGLSSMLPVQVLDPKKGDKILDACSSPGGKTILINDLVQKEAEIYAVENNQARFFSLKKNLAKHGAENVNTIKLNITLLGKIKPVFLGYFDKIICDVPCSNEANLRGPEFSGISYWNKNLGKRLQMLQKKILASCLSLLKTGGVLVYSTCTYSLEENEKVIDWALKKFRNIKVGEIQCDFPHQHKGIAHIEKLEQNPQVSKCIRVLPDENHDAFFVGKLLRF